LPAAVVGSFTLSPGGDGPQGWVKVQEKNGWVYLADCMLRPTTTYTK